MWRMESVERGGMVGWSTSLLRHLRPFLAGLGEGDGDRLFAALHCAALTALARPEGALLQAFHHALDALARRLPVLSPAALLGSHVFSPLCVWPALQDARQKKRRDRHFVYTSCASASATSLACPTGCTFSKTRAIFPVRSMMNVVRLM